MIRRIIQIDEENAMDAAFAPKPVMKALSAWWTEKPSCCGRIIVTA